MLGAAFALTLSFAVASLMYDSCVAAAVCGAVLVHEVGHYVPARIAGLHRSGPIVAFPLGGFVVTALDEVPDRPRAAATIFAAGPIAGAVGAWLGAGAFAFTHSGFWLGFTRVSIWLNLINLVPVGLLDGGRLASYARVPPAARLVAVLYAATTSVWTCVVVGVSMAVSAVARPSCRPCPGAERLACAGLVIPALALLVLQAQLPDGLTGG